MLGVELLPSQKGRLPDVINSMTGTTSTLQQNLREGGVHTANRSINYMPPFDNASGNKMYLLWECIQTYASAPVASLAFILDHFLMLPTNMAIPTYPWDHQPKDTTL